MKTPKTSRTLGVIKNVFNVRKWSDFDRMKAFTQYLGTGIKKLIIPQKESVADKKRTFNDAVNTMHLSEEELIVRSTGLYRLSLLMCLISIAIFGYTIYQLVNGNLKAVIVSFVVALIGLALAFRYHYWYFQIKERKLGCTLREWYRKGLLGDK